MVRQVRNDDLSSAVTDFLEQDGSTSSFGTDVIAEQEWYLEEVSDQDRLEDERQAKIQYGKTFLAELNYNVRFMSDEQVLDALEKEFGHEFADSLADDTDDSDDNPAYERHQETKHPICM